MAALKPAFPQWGEASTTAGNASGVGDGAAMCILTTRERAEKEGMEIIGKWIGAAVVGAMHCLLELQHRHSFWATGVEPRHMGISPIYAIPKILEQHGLTKEDIDIFEARERPFTLSIANGGVNRSMRPLPLNSPIAANSFKFQWIKSIPSKHFIRWKAG